ncbi:hypothetical protein LMG18090_02186 [Ralstonia mannitolilytica]|nr:hypothetical protein LMG18090_02186 [Ralstonia mannitolilytica]
MHIGLTAFLCPSKDTQRRAWVVRPEAWQTHAPEYRRFLFWRLYMHFASHVDKAQL